MNDQRAQQRRSAAEGCQPSFSKKLCWLAACLSAALAGSDGFGQASVSTPFAGVRHTHRRQTAPRTVSIHVLEIDLDAPGIRFLVTPRNAATVGENAARTVRTFVAESGAQIGINATFYMWASATGYTNRGLVASNGHVYSPFGETEDGVADVRKPWPVLNISADNLVSIVNRAYPYEIGTATSPAITPYNAVSGSERIVINGRNVTGSITHGEPTSNRSRTVAGYTRDRRLVLATVDEVGGSTGLRTAQMADLLVAYGVIEGVNLDGGGSTTMVFADPVVRLVNAPSNGGGGERAVATHLAVFANPASTVEDVLVYADFFASDRGTFAQTLTASGSTQGVLDVSTNVALADDAATRGWLQRLTIRDDPATTGVAENPHGGWFVRHLSGASGAPTQNVARSAEGWVGVRLRTTSPGVRVALAIDVPETTKRGVSRAVLADGEWHVYEWQLSDANDWETWVGGAGGVGAPTFTLDSLQFFGPDADAMIDIDWVAHDVRGSLRPWVREQAEADSALVLSDDFAAGIAGWHGSGPTGGAGSARWEAATQSLVLPMSANTHLVRHFPRTTLRPGERLEVGFDVSFRNVPAGNSRTLRVGLFDSGESGAHRTMGDGHGTGEASAAFNDYRGYRVDHYSNFAVTTTSNPLRFTERTGVASGTSALITTTAPAGYGTTSSMDAVGDYFTIQTGVTYRITFSVERTTSGDTALLYRFAAADGSASYWRPFSFGTGPQSFDTLAFGIVNLVADALVIDNVTVHRRWQWPAGTYGAWRVSHAWEEAAGAPAADPDGDGRSNLLEWAFGGHPLRADADGAGLQLTGLDDVTFPHRRHSALDYAVEESPDLVGWTTLWSTADGPLHPTVRAWLQGERYDTVRLRLAPTAQRRFVRVRVAALPE